MAHYALLDSNNVVTKVITGKNEGEDGINWEQHYGEFCGQTCKRTSYNTAGNTHHLGGNPYRKNYAGIGYTYDTVRDAFISPQPYPSWVLNESTCVWEAPVPYPATGKWQWNESVLNWVEI